jgi:hypothetical protein
MRKLTQGQQVLNYLEAKGTITSVTAIGVFGITRLADVVFRLKKAGNNIVTEMKDGVNGAPYAEYRIGK